MGSQELYALQGTPFLQHLIISALYILLTFVFSIIFSEHSDNGKQKGTENALQETSKTGKEYIKQIIYIIYYSDTFL